MNWNERVLSNFTLDTVIAHWKSQHEWLYQAPSQSLQQVSRDLVTAIFNAFNPEMPQAFPTFKRKGDGDSFRVPQGFEVDINKRKVYVPNIGWLSYRSSFNEMPGTINSMTVSRDGEHWNVAIQVELEIPEPVHPSTSRVGIDMGIANFAVLSTGEVIEPLNSFRRHERKLAMAQRSLSRKSKFGKNWHKQKAVVRARHRGIANCRREFLHQSSNRVTNNHSDIRMEGLRVANMSASADGSLVEPGVNVRAKSGLNKSILDQGWSEYRRQLTYKASWKGGKVSLVDPRHTSQECPECHHVEAANRATRDWFCCVKCGHAGPADLVAAINISQRDTLPEPVKRSRRKPKSTKPSGDGCRDRNPSVMEAANPATGAGESPSL